MRKLMVFALPFGAGCALCHYLLPESWRLWTALIALLAALPAAFLPVRVRIGAAGLAAGLVWFTGYAALVQAPARALAGTEGRAVMELTGCPEETDFGARCQVRVQGMAGRAVYYGGRELLDLEPGYRVTASVKYDSADELGGEESAYFSSRGVFLRLYGRGEMEAEPGGGYLPQRMARALKSTAGAVYDQPERGLLLAMLTGERDGLDSRSQRQLSEAGLMHLTAVSGLHCGFLISLLGVLTLRRQRLTALVGYPVLLTYMLMAGSTPSVVRACVMVGLTLLAPLVGREADAPTSLSAAALVILLVNPFAIASVSFQLSFSAVAGLLALSPRVYRAMKAGPAFVRATLAASAGVTVFTAPLSAAYFGSLSLVSPLANLLVLWMAPVLFALALTVTSLCALLPAAAPLAVLPAALARYVLWTAELLCRIPGHSLRFSTPAAAMWLVLVYGLLGRVRRRGYVLAALLALASLEAARALPRLTVRNDALTAVVVDVGQGAAALLHAGDSTILVDCGSLSRPERAGDAVAEAMETYGWTALDAVVLTHCHADHAGGLPSLLEQVPAERLLLPRTDPEEDAADLLARERGVAVEYVEEPSRTDLGQGTLTVYPPVTAGETNEEGLSVLCSLGDFDLLITGDMDSATEAALLETYPLPDLEVLLAGHHGSKYATSQTLLEETRPEVGIISVGPNTFGHPTAEAMGRMTGAGMDLYRTDRQGNILIRVHGEGETEHGVH
ncbi:MAG: MBL fold metallo-hydrolase [Oscillospiraceae bacterium]|nr:MBL fold metallo-hydrolase [Oscillospiraceae bacterium]